MKHPNGYGSVFKLSGNRRKPWAVRITTGWTDEGKQIYKYLNYYKTRQEAILALAKYNDDPYDVDKNRITFSEMFDMYMDSRRETSEKAYYGLMMSYNLSESLHDKRFTQIRTNHLQSVIDNCGKSYSTKLAIRSLYNQMYKFAIPNDLAHKNYAQFVKLPKKKNLNERRPFTLDEINLLWENVDKKEFADAVLVMIYTGMRPGEVVDIKVKDINLDERYLIAGIKTDAGRDRIIPLHKKIVPIIEKRLENSNNILSFFDGKALSYATLRNRFNDLMDDLGMDHRPHDCRHTFATLMDNAGANKLSIKTIMGHSIDDITDGTYTHKDIAQLIKAIDLLD